MLEFIITVQGLILFTKQIYICRTKIVKKKYNKNIKFFEFPPPPDISGPAIVSIYSFLGYKLDPMIIY